MGSRRERVVLGTVDLPDTAVAPRVLDRFHAGGGRALDVANVYRDGESARAVGRWLPGRDDVVLYAKGCHPPACRPELVGSEVERACRLLGREYVDVFILHRDDPAYPVARWAEALAGAVDAGRIGAFGVSNWTLARLRELKACVAADGTDRLVALSNHFSLAEMRSPPWPDCLAVTRQDLDGIDELGVALLAWSSLATGFFAGRDTPHWDTPANRARRDRARELAGRVDATAPAVALAYVLNQPANVMALVGTRSERHVEEALAAAAIELTPAQLAWLETGID
jgi:aryl-alcohol dehydrogenase-like predicted oxidoreductase